MNFIKDGRYPITLQDIYRENSQTSFSSGFDPRELGYEPVVPVAKPTYDPISQVIVELPPVHDGTRWLEVWEVRNLDAETVATNQAVKAASDAAAVTNKIEALWRAADAYTSNYISGVAIGILTIGVIQQLPKALAIKQWSNDIWTEYYTRKAAVTPTSVDNLDFSMFGPIPHSVPELQAEVGMWYGDFGNDRAVS